MSEPDEERVERWNACIDDAIRQVASERVEGGVLTSWVLVFEIMEPDGNRSIQRSWPADLTVWARDGLLRAATCEVWHTIGLDDDE